MLIEDDAFASTASSRPSPRARAGLRDAPASASDDSDAGDLSTLVGRSALLRLALTLAREDAAGADRHFTQTPISDEGPVLRLDARGNAAAALALIADPAALIEPNGDIVAANAAFLARAPRLRPLFGAQFFAARAAAARGQPPGAARMSSRAVEGGVLILFALHEGGGADGGAIGVLRAPQTGERCCDPALLEQAFALTPAEARLACALMRTKSLPAAIRELGLKDKTGRTYLDRIFQKTGVRSQLQLYAILMELYLLSTPGA
jgi:DNA-binding CsgD family transcriptional regulator